MFKNANAMLVFAEVVKRGSFTAAAKALNISKVAVSNHVKQLEMQLGIKLLNRSTRKISLTEAGIGFSACCFNVSKEVEYAESQVLDLKLKPTGKLRVACSVNFGVRHITPAVAEFKKQHPDIAVELLVSDKKVDLIADNIDVAFRLGPMPSSSLVAKKIVSSKFIVCASPEYFVNRALPSQLHDLENENWIIYSLSNSHYVVKAVEAGKSTELKVNGDVSTDNSMVRRTFLLKGLGVAKISHLDVKSELSSQKLINVLPDVDFGTMDMYALYQDRLLAPKKLAVFLDFIERWFQ